VESSCELGNEPSGSIKCWELPSGCTTYGLSRGTQLQELVSYLDSYWWSIDKEFWKICFSAKSNHIYLSLDLVRINEELLERKVAAPV
jgi:hypothetical protein